MALKVRKTRVAPMPCPISHCMGFLGGAWTPNILWYLSAGPRRFSELRLDIPAISAKVLTRRLRDMEERGIVMRRVMPTSPPSVEYELTELGREFGPVISAIISVGQKLMAARAPIAA